MPLIIGSGPNGLAAAFYLARAGLRPIVFERREDVGGGAATIEVHPGFRVPAFSHEVLIHERIVNEMGLRAHGLELIDGDVEACAPSPDGPPIVIYRDPARTARELKTVHDADASAWPAFRAALERTASVLAPLLEAPPPDIDRPGARDLMRLLAAGRRFRAIGRRDGFRLLRWLSMPVEDLLDEWFAHDRLQALLAGPAVSGLNLGPRSAGSGLVLLLREAHRQLAGGRTLRVRGGPGALVRAMVSAATAAGAEIRCNAPVERILTDNGAVRGVVVEGREIAADTVLSAADPRTTLLRLVDPAALGPAFLWRARNYRAKGTLAKVNLALSALPRFTGVGDAASLSGRIVLASSVDDLERAFDHVKYGEISSEPWLDMIIPSLLDPALAPAGGHVASVYVHCVPVAPRGMDAAAARQAALTKAMAVLERYAPGISSLVLAAQTMTPDDLELVLGIAGGHIFHGELAPDQLFAMRPLLGHGRYDAPVGGLHLCSAGTHPGGFLTAASGRLAAEQVIKAGTSASRREGSGSR